MTTQVQAVVNATKIVLGSAFQAGVSVKDYITKEQMNDVIDMVMLGFQVADVDLSDESRAKFDTPAKLKAYTSGMVRNHYAKCKELNGGVKHETKNPGSKTGSIELKQALGLRKFLADSGMPVNEVLEAKIAELSVVEVKVKELDVSALPEELQELARAVRAA